MALLSSILMLLAIVVIHEAGHFVAAVLTGIRVRSLNLGFPVEFPLKIARRSFQIRLYLRWRWGEYRFTVSPILLGAAVDVDEEQLWKAPLWVRTAVFLGGPAANFASLLIVAFLLNGFTEGLAYSWRVIWLSAVSPLFILFGHVSAAEVMGPVGIVSISTKIIEQDFRLLIHLFAIISGALGTFNLLPIPVLDGGRVLMAVLADRGLSKRWSKIIIYGSFAVLILAMTALTAKDISLL